MKLRVVVGEYPKDCRVETEVGDIIEGAKEINISSQAGGMTTVNIARII